MLRKNKEGKEKKMQGNVGHQEIMTKLLEHDSVLKEHGKRLDKHDDQFNRIIDKLLEHDSKFIVLEEKMDKNHREILEILDTIMGNFTNIDQEQICTTSWLRRHDKEIAQLQKHTGLVS